MPETPSAAEGSEISCPAPEALEKLRGNVTERTIGHARLWVEWVTEGLSIEWGRAPSDPSNTTDMIRKARNVLVHTDGCDAARETPGADDLQERTWRAIGKWTPLLDNPVSVADHFERGWPTVRAMLALSPAAKEAVRNLARTTIASSRILRDPAQFRTIRERSLAVGGDKPDYRADPDEFNAWRGRSNDFSAFMEERFGVSEALGGVPGILFRRALSAKDESGREAILTAYEKMAFRVLGDLR